jgi:hypothetical protein
VEASLPLRARVERVVLLEQAQPDRWQEVAAFPLEET